MGITGMPGQYESVLYTVHTVVTDGMAEVGSLQAISSYYRELFGRLSPILLTSGIPEDIAANAVRLSVGRGTELRDVDVVVADLKRAVNEILIEVATSDEAASARH